MERTSDELYWQLMRDGLRGKTAGTVKPSGMRKPGAADESARRQFARQGGASTAAGVAEAIKAAIRNGTGRVIRDVPFLMIVCGGKA